METGHDEVKLLRVTVTARGTGTMHVGLLDVFSFRAERHEFKLLNGEGSHCAGRRSDGNAAWGKLLSVEQREKLRGCTDADRWGQCD